MSPTKRDEFGRFVGSGPKAKVTDVDKGFSRLRTAWLKLRGGHVVRLGIQGAEAKAEHQASGMTNAQLGVIHEFGSKDGKIPSRPWLRGTVDRERDKYGRLLEKAIKRAARGGNPKKELALLVGEPAVADVRATFNRSLGLQKLAQSTIDRKGSTTPLVNIGTLRDSVTYKVK